MIELLNQQESAKLAKFEKFDDNCTETACAMANADGGIIIIGVSADGTVVGVSDENKTVEEYIQQINSATQPAIFPEGEKHEIDLKRVFSIHIPESPLKPISFDGRCYRRLDTKNLLLSTSEISQLHWHSLGQSWDAAPHNEAVPDNLYPEKIRKFVRETNERRRRNLDENAPVTEILQKLSLAKNDQLTTASLLLFGKDPQSHIPHARIKAGRFKSETLIIDDQDITGTLFEQIDQAFTFIQKHLTVRLVITGQPQREDVWDYPLEALREGLINAVCHRDYAIPTEIQIRIYDDQLIIWNPGNLLHGIALDDLKNKHRSVLRNKLISSVFYDTGLIEKWGSGTTRIIHECKKLGLPEPEWREQQGMMLILRKEFFTEDLLIEKGLSERQLKAVAHVKKRRRITNQEYQLLVGVKKRTASEELGQLEEKKIFERVGSTGKGTYYKLRGK